MKIGRRVRQIRKSKGVTQVQLAAATGIGQPTISDLENDVHIPRIETLETLAIALGVPIHVFFLPVGEDRELEKVG